LPVHESSARALLPDDSDPALDDDTPPSSGSRPAVSFAEEPLATSGGQQAISPAELRSFLGQPEVQADLRKVVGARLGKGTPGDVIDDVSQDAMLAILSSPSRPRSMETAGGWVRAATRRAVSRYFRRKATEPKWLDPAAGIDEVAVDGDFPDDEWLIGPWLARAVSKNATDEETLELLRYKAVTGMTYKEVAAVHGLTPSALRSRVFDFKAKYEPRWQRRQALLILLWIAGVVLVAAVAWALLRPRRPVEIAPDPAPPVFVPAPSVTPSATSAPDTPFEPATPTRHLPPDKP
jgi:DNA-directed RNA polymerase specialized sigma24 family protein